MNINKSTKKWLKKENENFENNLVGLQAYIGNLSLSFLEEGQGGCIDPDYKETHSICFYDNDPRVAKVVVSSDKNIPLLNKETHGLNINIAMAMLIHEAGHFIGESHHIKLDDIGAQLSSIDNSSYKLKKYSQSPYINFISGEIKIDENSSSVSFENIKIRDTYMDFSKTNICSLLNLGKEYSSKHIVQDGVEFWGSNNDSHKILKIGKNTNNNYQRDIYTSLICELPIQ